MKIIGAIRGLSQYYSNGTERLEIWVDKDNARGLPYVDGERMAISLKIGSQQYTGGIRSTIKNKYVWVCPDIEDENGQKDSLTNALKRGNFKKNQQVYLEVDGVLITVLP